MGHQEDRCGICSNFGNFGHILNWCPVAMEQGRQTWRHNSVLEYIVKALKAKANDNMEIYADLPNHSLNGGTVPADVCTTGQRPDITILERNLKKNNLGRAYCSARRKC